MPENIPSLRQIDHHNNESIRFYHNTEAEDYPAHWHMSYEVIMPAENIYTVLVENTVYELYPGDVIIIPSGVVHEIFAPETGSRYFIMLNREQIESIEGLISYEHCFYPCLYISHDISIPSHRLIKEYYMNALMEHSGSSALSRAAVKAQLEMLFISAARLISLNNPAQAEEGGRYKRTRQQIVFSDLCAYISAHCAETLTPEALAAQCGYSRFHFEKLFRSYAGKTLHEFITLQRINMVKRLLYNTQDSITDIALKSGFSSIATFNRAFQQHEGMSPTEYRSLGQILPRI